MKMLLCIPIEVNADTTARKVIRTAVKNKLLEWARKPDEAAAMFRRTIDTDTFLVRAPESAQPAAGVKDGADNAPRPDAITAPVGSSGVG